MAALEGPRGVQRRLGGSAAGGPWGAAEGPTSQGPLWRRPHYPDLRREREPQILLRDGDDKGIPRKAPSRATPVMLSEM